LASRRQARRRAQQAAFLSAVLVLALLGLAVAVAIVELLA
jgi:hypothetical protein